MRVFILRGVSGSGKSTLAGQIAGHFGATSCRTVSADDYFHLPPEGGAERDGWGLERGPYNFNPSELGFAHAYCMRNFINCLSSDLDVVVDNTNTTWGEIAPYVLVAQSYRAEVVIIQVHCDVDTAISRNVHGVPESSVRAMAERLREPLPPFAPPQIDIWGDMPTDIFGCLSEVPNGSGMSIQRYAGSMVLAVYDRHPYDGHDDDGWVYTRQAIVV